MTQFSNKFKKRCFWPIFPIFGAEKIFLENPALSHKTSYGFLAPCQNLEKVNDTIQRKCPDRQFYFAIYKKRITKLLLLNISS